MNEPELQFVDAAGLRFGYLSRGNGPLVLLLHGFPDTAHTWDRALSAVARAGFRGVAPFMRGYHPTAVPADGRYDADTLGSDVVALLDALGEDSAIVVGHDWGAVAGYAAAALFPRRLTKLITLGLPHQKGVTPGPRLLWSVRHFFALNVPGAASRIRSGAFAYVDELWRRWSPGWDVPADETAPAKACLSQPGSLEAAIGYYAALRPWPPPSVGMPIEVPTVAFAALRDGALGMAAYERARRAFVGPYEVVPFEAGHFLHRQLPDLFEDRLLAALR